MRAGQLSTHVWDYIVVEYYMRTSRSTSSPDDPKIGHGCALLVADFCDTAICTLCPVVLHSRSLRLANVDGRCPICA